MVKEKKPTIYSDRGTIGSSDELDEYGVWVKSEPQDLSDSLPEASSEFDTDDPFGPEPASDTPDLNIPDIDILPDLGTTESEEVPDASGFSDQMESEESWDIPDIDDVVKDSEDTDSTAIQDIQVDDFEFEPLDLPEEGAEESIEFVEIEVKDEIVSDDFSEVGIDEPADQFDTDQAALDTDPLDFSVSMDEPEPAEESDSFIESDSVTESGSQKPAVSELSNQLLLRIAEELSSIRAELTSLKKDFAGMKAESQPQEQRDHGFFNEEEDETIALTGDELSTILNVETKDESEASEDTAGILDIDETAPTVETKAPEHGFFDDEEDETIALTGDELNNILNTADFTEETGTDVAGEEIDLPVEEAEILPSEDLLMEELPSEELPPEELVSEELAEELPPEDFPMDELTVEEFALNEIPIEETPNEEASVEILAEEEPEMISLDEITDDLDLGTGLEEINLDESGEQGLTELEESDEAPTIELDESIVLDEPVELDDSFDTSLTEPVELGESAELSESTDVSLDSSIDESLGVSLELEEFAIPEPVENDELPDFNISAEDDIIELSETGVSPMTPAPEDTSFLDEEESAAVDELSIDDTVEEIGFDEPSDEPSIDLSTAVIDEPDLSVDLQDNPIEEPSLENISIDLDLDESSMSEEAEDDAGLGAEDITMDMGEELDLPLMESDELSGMESSDYASVDVESVDEQPLDLESSDFPSVDFQSEEEISVSPEVFDLDEEETAVSETVPDEADDELALIPEAFTGDISEDQIPLEESPDEETILEDDIFSQDEIPEPKAKAIPSEDTSDIPVHLKQELKAVLSYMDKLLESLPDEKIEEFARSDYFDTYKKLFSELGLI
jgi:hypothetical protein